ncbi:hypothetical protein JRO89_XS13G0076800 [Xanthoceras sorbifolium]|uniref:Uncharacterized protein n=1 Tax=Xanthoceras sorbifolium TaxID=99658 RepID=A0ABQ8H765_9ROSI|nr:hypothetical protein JRO89_XS13G0076800 [Xanthoceras sorbifolium]
MATSAFKSTTKRTAIGASPSSTNDDSSSSTNRSSAAHRRSRSLSRFSRRLPGQDMLSDEATPRGRFVNTVRGTGFPEISLDDLAIELFDSSDDRGRSAARNDDAVRPRNDGRSGGGGGGASVRRGRSVSRQVSKGGAGDFSSGGRAVSDSNNYSRRRRSVSVVRCQISDSESDLDRSQNSSNRASLKSNVNGNSHMPISHRPSASNHRPVLRRSVSQKDLKYLDDYSSQSSALTDDEGRDAHSGENGIERTIRAVYAQKKAEHPTGEDMNGGLYEAMRTELRHAVEEIRMELTQEMAKKKTSTLHSNKSLQSNNSDSRRAVSTIRRNYATKLEQSEMRKQDLLAEVVLEEQRGKELSKIVKELLPDPKNSIVDKPARARKRSNERSRMSMRLTEEAEKYIEDFITNVEDTDISSLDGERSDTSSILGGIAKMETLQSPAISKPLPVEMDGVVLPWLQWETTTDASPQSCETNKTRPKTTPKSNFWDASQESTTAQDLSCYSTSSHGSWSPVVTDDCSHNLGDDRGNKCGEPGSYLSQYLPNGTSRSRFDMEEYFDLQRNEELLFERLMQQQRISSGSIILCNQMFL